MDKRGPPEFVSQIVSLQLLSPQDGETGVSLLLSKLFKFGRNSPSSESSSAPAPSSTDEEAPLARPAAVVAAPRAPPESEESAGAEAGASRYSDDYGGYGHNYGADGRSLQNVVKRIGSLVALKSSASVTRYADTEQARYWMPDSVSKECYECGARFGAFRRRHHCRVCGQIFCTRCCSHRVPGHVCGCAGGLRVCTYCCRIVLGYLQSVDGAGGAVLSADLKALQDNLRAKMAADERSPERGFLLGGGSSSVAEASKDAGDVAAELGFAKALSLQDTYRHLCISLPLQQHRYRLVRYPSVWRGGDILQWLIEHGNIPTRVQASELCQSLMNEGLMECVTEHQSFTDYALYRPINLPVLAAAEQDQKLMGGSTSSFCLNLNLTENSAHLVRGQKSDENKADNSNEGNDRVPLQSESHSDGKLCCKTVEATGLEHLRLLFVQGLIRAGINVAWSSILLQLCQQVANMITPDVTASEWDVRRAVRIKRVAGGSMRESCAVGGVVFSKNVAHRGMPKNLSSPKILLLRCSIVYQRVESKLISLEPVLLQEQEYLRNCCARILALAPDVIVVQGSVSRLAQDELRSHGKVLVIGVRKETLDRLARCTNADILTSIDARVGAPRLGICQEFYLMNYDIKTLMVFEGFENDRKGCSVILRGGSLEELSLVKKVIGLMLLAAYNWRLESSLLGDMSATLPKSSTSLIFIDNSKDNSPEKMGKIEASDDVLEDFDDTIKIIERESALNSSIKDEVGKESKLSIALTNPLSSEKPSDKAPAVFFGTAVDDFSDPLRSNRIEDEVFYAEKASPKTKPSQDVPHDTLRNRWSADETVLSMSPHVRINIPYLESDPGLKCPLKNYYCTPLFYAPKPTAPATPRPTNRLRKYSVKTTSDDLKLMKPHPFVTASLTQNAEESDVKTMLAFFRANGGRLPHGELLKNARNKQDIIDPTRSLQNIDPLDPGQHQRMYLLFYSFSERSPNAPDFCINPSIVRMDMYGNNDLSLGQFLERHCFSQQYTCPSQTCQIPLMHHIRNFVHGDGCITVTCVENSTGGNQNLTIDDEDGKHMVMWWCRCMICGEVGGGGGSACLRPVSLAISLAKYLELRLNAPRYVRCKSCHHSLNQNYAHYFASGNITSCFRYKKIKSWDICLPPSSLSTFYNTRQIRDSLIGQVNDLILKGHEVFTNITDTEHDKEQAYFKQHTERIQLDLTSASLQEQINNAGIIRSLWSISDAIIIGEKMLQDSFDRWTNSKSTNKVTQDSIKEFIADSKIDCDNSSQIDVSASDCVADSKSILTSNSDVETGGEEEEDKTDRRGLRTILSQLLSNSQRAHHNGVVLCGGVVPVVVRAGEISSLIAAALASPLYHQQLNNSSQSKGYCTDSDEKEVGNSREKIETDAKSKNSKNYEHIDVQLQDGLFCCVYHPRQFLKLRQTLLCPLQSNENIVNNFDLKPAVATCDSDARIKEDASSLAGDVAQSVADESSPSIKKEDRAKRFSRDKATAMEMGEVEEAFVRSLTHCVPWAARGGKSGSSFCKTKDDRFILKEMSKLELQLFVELAPHYFNYVHSCYQNNYPTLLARIVGVYRVGGVEGVVGGLLVIENLWHGRSELSKCFDLKGAQRNRLAEQGAPDAVLLDENLLNLRWENPIYVQSHSAGVLWAAIERDTTFLASHDIMDYSLLVGLDEEKQELVLGIIDYIRTFTWDKKLEHIVKKGLGSGQPTIVSPEQYKSRFCVAMKKYFLQSPNQWEDLDKGLLCDKVVECCL